MSTEENLRSEGRLPTLTRRQDELYRYLFEYYNQRGYIPTVEEIARWRGSSMGGTHEMLEKIHKKGWLAKDPDASERKYAPVVDPDARSRRAVYGAYKHAYVGALEDVRACFYIRDYGRPGLRADKDTLDKVWRALSM